MGAHSLAFSGVWANGMTDAIIGTVLNPPPSAATVPPPTPLVSVPEEVDYDFYLVYLDILYRVFWEIGI